MLWVTKQYLKRTKSYKNTDKLFLTKINVKRQPVETLYLVDVSPLLKRVE